MDTKYLHDLILKISDKVEELHNQVGNMQSTCKLRHSIDLKEQISLIRRDLQYIEKEIIALKEHNKSEDNLINTIDKTFQEFKASIDLIKIRITTIQNQSDKNKQKKYTFNKEIFVGIILIILTTIITLVGNRIYDIMFNVEKQYEKNTSKPSQYEKPHKYNRSYRDNRDREFRNKNDEK